MDSWINGLKIDEWGESLTHVYIIQIGVWIRILLSSLCHSKRKERKRKGKERKEKESSAYHPSLSNPRPLKFPLALHHFHLGAAGLPYPTRGFPASVPSPQV